MKRRLRIDGKLTGRQRRIEKPEPRRAFLQFEAFRLRRGDGRLSTAMWMREIAEQLANQWKSVGMEVVPAYEEIIDPVIEEGDLYYTVTYMGREHTVYFGNPRKV